LGIFFSQARLVTLMVGSTGAAVKRLFFVEEKKLTRNLGCQIFLDTIYQNEGKDTKLPQPYQMAIKCTK
jgi:hypothetical protein